MSPANTLALPSAAIRSRTYRDVAADSRRKQLIGRIDRTLDMLEERAGMFFATFEGAEGREGFRSQSAWLEKHDEKYQDVLRALELLGTPELVKRFPGRDRPAGRRTEGPAGAVRFGSEQ